MKKIEGLAIIVFAILFTGGFLYAADMDIYGSTSLNVQPNVLIVFDTSGSMDETVPGTSEAYNPSGNYTAYGSYVEDGVYYWYAWTRRWVPFPNRSGTPINYTTINYTAAREALGGSAGQWEGRISTNYPYNSCTFCLSYSLRRGKYLNYLQSPLDEDLRKVDVGIGAITPIVQTRSNFNFGLMRFNGYSPDPEPYNRGGKVIVPIQDGGASNAAVVSALPAFSTFVHYDGWSSSGGTPLAETMAEAGLYFAGKASYANTSTTYMPTGSSGLTYTSPIQWRCQKNFIILITDGMSTVDEGGDNNSYGNVFSVPYINDIKLYDTTRTPYRDYDLDGQDPGTNGSGGTHWLDDVTKFLYDQDLLGADKYEPGGLNKSFASEPSADDSDPEKFWKQNIVTYIIGFDVDTATTNFLRRAAETNGGGQYFSATNATELQEALDNIMGEIASQNANYVAPVVPVSKMSNTYSGNSVFFGMFYPKTNNIWWGNLKKFGIDEESQLLDKNGADATDEEGNISNDASTIWPNSTSDGPNVIEGGLGAYLLTLTSSRNFYTADASHTMQNFVSTNTNITDAILNIDATQRADLFGYVRADGDYHPISGTADKKRTWVLGDIQHSRPLVLRDTSVGNRSVIFFGANDGFLHCVVDNEGNSYSLYTDDTVSEAWNFVPWDLLGNLHNTHTNSAIRGTSEYTPLVDGTPVAYPISNQMLLTFGLRRGGSNYYTLNIGSADTTDGDYTGGYSGVSFRWQIGPTVTGMGEPLGQSWSKPYVAKFKTGSGSNDYTTALILAGGYDDVVEDEINAADLPSPLPSSTKGRAIYAVRGSTGALISNLSFNATDNTSLGMTHSFVDFLAFDRNSNEFTDGIYAGDMGGNLFGFKDRDASTDKEDGTWEAKKVFKARDEDAGTDDIILKFFYAPDAVKMSWGDYIYIGTGDREHPLETATVNRFYAIQNRWSVTTTLTESDLRDVTAYSYPYDETSGWFIRLEDPGEKVVSQPLVYNNVVYFTTYVPSSAASTSTDLCAASDIGYEYLYGLDFRTGKAVFDWYTGNNTPEEEIIAKEDRRKYVGAGIPTPPTLVVTKKGTQVVTATSEKFTKIDVTPEEQVNRYYWKQY